MSERKCTSCGSVDFIPMPLLKGTLFFEAGDLRSNVDSFACSKCGHIELYAIHSQIDEYYEKEAELLKIKEEKARLYSELIEKQPVLMN